MFSECPKRNLYHNWIYSSRAGLRGVEEPVGSDHCVIGVVLSNLHGLFNLIFTRH